LDGEARVPHPVHRGRHDRQLDPPAAQLPGDVHLVRVERDRPRDQGDVVEAIRDPGLPPPADPHAHVARPPAPAATGWDRSGPTPQDVGRLYEAPPRGVKTSVAARHAAPPPTALSA